MNAPCVSRNFTNAAHDRQSKWERSDSNREPRDYESPALTVELRSRGGGLYSFAASSRSTSADEIVRVIDRHPRPDKSVALDSPLDFPADDRRRGSAGDFPTCER